MSIQHDTAGDHPVYTGHDVVDEQGNRVGKVVDVIYDDAATSPVAAAVDTTDRNGAGREPSWLIVDPGVLRSAHYLPVAGSYRTADGSIVTPWDREWVRASAKAPGDHILTREHRDELVAHYSLAE